MDREELQKIANSGGYGTGAKARQRFAAAATRRECVPAPQSLSEMLATTDIADGALIASLGNCPDTKKDWHIVVDGEHCRTASEDAATLAALWNAYRAGDLVWRES